MSANCWNGYEENRKVILINYHIIELLLPAQIKYLLYVIINYRNYCWMVCFRFYH